MSDFDLPWEKFVGFSLFTLEEDMIFDKVINQKTPFSTVFQVIDTSTKTREELKKSSTISLINDVFRVDYHIFYNIILASMFLPDIPDDAAAKIIGLIKEKLVDQLKDYGSIDKMEPKSQTALIKKLGDLISERASSQIKYDYFPTKKPQQVVVSEPHIPTVQELREQAKTESHVPPSRPSQPESQPESQPTYTPSTPSETGKVENLLEFVGVKADAPVEEKDEKKVQLTQQLLEETKKQSIERVLSSVIKGLSTKTGVCFVATGTTGKLETLTYGMSDKHADFVLGILSKYPEVIKQTLDSGVQEKTLDAGDGVVILEETESGMLVSITKNKEEIPVIAKRLAVVKTMIDEFLKASF